jgi:hypothetical protein
MDPSNYGGDDSLFGCRLLWRDESGVKWNVAKASLFTWVSNLRCPFSFADCPSFRGMDASIRFMNGPTWPIPDYRDHYDINLLGCHPIDVTQVRILLSNLHETNHSFHRMGLGLSRIHFHEVFRIQTTAKLSAGPPPPPRRRSGPGTVQVRGRGLKFSTPQVWDSQAQHLPTNLGIRTTSEW